MLTYLKKKRNIFIILGLFLAVSFLCSIKAQIVHQIVLNNTVQIELKDFQEEDESSFSSETDIVKKAVIIVTRLLKLK